jgi:4-amino-4-deoxy-L-arabinose transferase-like glycosyltransferase
VKTIFQKITDGTMPGSAPAIRLTRVAELLFVMALCYFPLCYRIDALSIRQWDEARNAVNAIEMLKNHNYLVRYYDGQPEIWEVKPPLLIWLQVISLRIFGYNQLAIRFPTVFATFMTVFFLIWYFNKYHHNRYIGYMAALILVTSQGYIDRHIARTGDHDALLILITTVMIFLYYEFLISKRPADHLIILFSILFILGVLTKSIAIFFILPGLLLSTFLFKAQKKLFTNKGFYIAIIIFIAGSGSYYVLREMVQPGYLKAVWQLELFHRYFNKENQFGSSAFWDYGKNFFTSRYSYWIYFLLLSMILSAFYHSKMQGIYKYLMFNSIVLFLTLSCGSKQLWYDGPLFPLFASIIALFIYSSFQALYLRWHPLNLSGPSLAFLLSLILVIYPGRIVMKNAARVGEFPWDVEIYALGNYLSDPGNIKKIGSDHADIIFQGYSAHILFYVEGINQKTGKNVLAFKTIETVKPNDLLLVSEQTVLNSIKSRFRYVLLDENNSAYLLRILHPLENASFTADGK